MANTARASTLSPLHLQLIKALAHDAVRRGLLTDTEAAAAFLQTPANDAPAPRNEAPSKHRDSGHDLNRKERLQMIARNVAAGVGRAGEIAESWPGIAIGWAVVAVLAWYRWPVLEAMA